MAHKGKVMNSNKSSHSHKDHKLYVNVAHSPVVGYDSITPALTQSADIIDIYANLEGTGIRHLATDVYLHQ
jgi:hypothetical protein